MCNHILFQKCTNSKIVLNISYGCYYPLCRGSLCNGPMVVDREQNTITDDVMVFILDQSMILNSSQHE